MPEYKTCRTCGVDKPLDAYSPNGSAGRRVHCRSCRNKAAKERRLSDGGRIRRRSANNHLRVRYGLSIEEFEQLLVEQDGQCALCRTTSPGGRWNSFHVDHCHDTGRIRGLLCHGCNAALGQLGDDKGGLRRALSYVSNPVGS
jgi:hypothetical protein